MIYVKQSDYDRLLSAKEDFEKELKSLKAEADVYEEFAREIIMSME